MNSFLRLRQCVVMVTCGLAAACASLEPGRSVLPSLPALTLHCVQYESAERPSPAAEASAPVVVSAQSDPADELIERAWRKSLEGDRGTTMRLFARALNRTDATWRTERIHWSYGWAMLNLGDYDCALAHFERARSLDPAGASWLPHTLAVTYWLKGERDTALEWMDRAANADLGCWASAKSAERCTRRWQQKERKAMGELLHARREWKFR